MKYTILAFALSLAPLSAAEAAPTALTKSGTTLTSAARGGSRGNFGSSGYRSTGYNRYCGGSYGSSYCYPSYCQPYCYPSYCSPSYCYPSYCSPSYGYGSSYRSFSHRSFSRRK